MPLAGGAAIERTQAEAANHPLATGVRQLKGAAMKWRVERGNSDRLCQVAQGIDHKWAA
jgi:hypothetical protein